MKSSLVYSINNDQFNEYAVPSHSLCSLYFNKKALFISDDENRVFVVTLYNSEIQIKAKYQFNSTVNTICPVGQTFAFIAGLASGRLFYCADDQSMIEERIRRGHFFVKYFLTLNSFNSISR